MGYFLLIAVVGAFPFAPQQPRGVYRLPAPPPIVNGRPKILLAPGQACAIPLRNVLRKPWTYDNMVVHVPPQRRMPAEIVMPPAPSCDGVK